MRKMVVAFASLVALLAVGELLVVGGCGGGKKGCKSTTTDPPECSGANADGYPPENEWGTGCMTGVCWAQTDCYDWDDQLIKVIDCDGLYVAMSDAGGILCKDTYSDPGVWDSCG